MGRRERRRDGGGQRQSSPDSQIESVYDNPGTIKLLFETPSGFAMFAIDEKYLEKHIEIVWLHEFQKFEDRPNAIDLTTRKINPRLIKMIFKYIKFEEKLVVGRPEYKEIIEELLDLPCLYSDAVEEVMWGMQNLLRTLVPEEQSEMPMEDRIPMSKGLDMVLRRHGFVLEPKMINEHIIEMANTMYDIDLRERVHSKYLHNLLGEAFMAISGVDIEDWPLLKLATAVKKMCYPDEGILVGDPYEVNLNLIVQVFWDFEVIEYDAAKYRDKMDENVILKIYRDVVYLREDKITARNQLRRLVQAAKEALEAEQVPEEPATAGVNSKHQVNHTCLTVNPPEVPNQSSTGEGQHSITDAVGIECLQASNSTDAMKNISLHDTSANHNMPEGEVYASRIFPERAPVELTMSRTSKVINALSTCVVEGTVPEKEDENTSVEQMGAPPDGVNVGKNTVAVKEQAQETCAETESIVGQEEYKKTQEYCCCPSPEHEFRNPGEQKALDVV
ncbi:hypothetical protein ACQ4PT_016778 [Festuca glaucescens]